MGVVTKPDRASLPSSFTACMPPVQNTLIEALRASLMALVAVAIPTVVNCEDAAVRRSVPICAQACVVCLKWLKHSLLESYPQAFPFLISYFLFRAL